MFQLNNKKSVDRLRLDVKELSEKCEAVILAHNYQLPEIQYVADYVGDSLELAKIAVKIDSEFVPA